MRRSHLHNIFQNYILSIIISQFNALNDLNLLSSLEYLCIKLEFRFDNLNSWKRLHESHAKSRNEIYIFFVIVRVLEKRNAKKVLINWAKKSNSEKSIIETKLITLNKYFELWQICVLQTIEFEEKRWKKKKKKKKYWRFK